MINASVSKGKPSPFSSFFESEYCRDKRCSLLASISIIIIVALCCSILRHNINCQEYVRCQMLCNSICPGYDYIYIHKYRQINLYLLVCVNSVRPEVIEQTGKCKDNRIEWVSFLTVQQQQIQLKKLSAKRRRQRIAKCPVVKAKLASGPCYRTQG